MRSTQYSSHSLLTKLKCDPGMSAFDGIKEPVQSYVDIWTPMFRQASEAGLLPDFLLHWGHGAAMASVLLSMGVIGAYMGWQIRLGNGEDVTPLTLGDTIREAHPKSEYISCSNKSSHVFIQNFYQDEEISISSYITSSCAHHNISWRHSHWRRLFLFPTRWPRRTSATRRPGQEYLGISARHDGCSIGCTVGYPGAPPEIVLHGKWCAGKKCPRLSRNGHHGGAFCSFGNWSESRTFIIAGV